MSKKQDFPSMEQVRELCRRYPFGSQKGRGMNAKVICKFERPAPVPSVFIYVIEMEEKPNGQVECFSIASFGGDKWADFQYCKLSGIKALCEGSQGLKYDQDFKPVTIAELCPVGDAEHAVFSILSNTMARWCSGEDAEVRARRKHEEAEYDEQCRAQVAFSNAELITRKEVLTTSEAARYLGISKATLYKLTMARAIPHYKPTGKQCYFDRKELENWLRSNRVAPAEEIADKAAAYCMKKGGKK